ncbi:hypothetical protein [Micromonospora sagamiensis]|nr:hypothetical protein [Micromonospora sagamiensis]
MEKHRLAASQEVQKTSYLSPARAYQLTPSETLPDPSPARVS